jgi:hypothetical protein
MRFFLSLGMDSPYKLSPVGSWLLATGRWQLILCFLASSEALSA